MNDEIRRKPRILIVEDDALSVKLLDTIFNDEFELFVAVSGEKALKFVNEELIPDLILLDINLPGIDGYDVCKILKETDATRNVPIVFLTGRNSETDEERSFHLGAADFITKPFKPIIVRARVRNLIQLKLKTDFLEISALTDGLTGLANRRHFDEQLIRLWKSCARTNSSLSILMADIDQFKAYNDRYGHGAGDECLRQVSRVIEQSIRRPLDFTARYGGEEFVVILPDTPQEIAGLFAEKICKGVFDLQIPHDMSTVASFVTISIGYAGLKADNQMSVVSLVDCADSALYKAKEQGRNRFLSCQKD